MFINAQVIEKSGKPWVYEEGCLSIPNISENVVRKEKLKIKFLDENLKSQTIICSGIIARVIQHEYDHIEGKLFIDYIKPLRKKMLQGKLNDIHKGKVRVDYKMTQIK